MKKTILVGSDNRIVTADPEVILGEPETFTVSGSAEVMVATVRKILIAIEENTTPERYVAGWVVANTFGVLDEQHPLRAIGVWLAQVLVGYTKLVPGKFDVMLEQSGFTQTEKAALVRRIYELSRPYHVYTQRTLADGVLQDLE